MNLQSLSSLFEALGAALLFPGSAVDAEGRARALRADFPDLAAALSALAAAPAEGLEVAHAGLFLHGFWHPTIHLEASVHASGALRDPQVLASLEPVYAAAGLAPQPGWEPDHLGVLLALFGHLLGQAGSGENSSALETREAARRLSLEHLGPMVTKVSTMLDAAPPQPYYLGVFKVLRQAIRDADALLAAPRSA